MCTSVAHHQSYNVGIVSSITSLHVAEIGSRVTKSLAFCFQSTHCKVYKHWEDRTLHPCTHTHTHIIIYTCVETLVHTGQGSHVVSPAISTGNGLSNPHPVCHPITFPRLHVGPSNLRPPLMPTSHTATFFVSRIC